MKRNSFVFYESWYEGLRLMPRDVQGEVLTAIVEYGLYGETTEQLKQMTKAFFTLIKPQIDANQMRYENGCKGGAPIGNQNALKQPKNNQETTKKQPKNNQKQPNEYEYDYEYENDNDYVYEKESKKKKPAFSAPSQQECVDYFISQNSSELEGNKFFDYFTANGWKVGNKAPMKDWHAAARNWMRNSFSFSNPKKNAPTDINGQYDDVEPIVLTDGGF